MFMPFFHGCSMDFDGFRCSFRSRGAVRGLPGVVGEALQLILELAHGGVRPYEAS